MLVSKVEVSGGQGGRPGINGKGGKGGSGGFSDDDHMAGFNGKNGKPGQAVVHNGADGLNGTCTYMVIKPDGNIKKDIEKPELRVVDSRLNF